MDATTLTPESPLPDDVATLQALVRQLLVAFARVQAENTELKNKLDAALKHRFGRRSERQPKHREPKADDEPAKRRDEHGRSPLPEHLERRETVHDLRRQGNLKPRSDQRHLIGFGHQASVDQIVAELRKSPAYRAAIEKCRAEVAPFLLKKDAEAYASKIKGKVLGFDDALKSAVSGG